ncbi:hypothetical protein GGF32_008141 [Allomyces javanicus]|nr:hypothetical protein GGF32_008141 [Allomyces javanicus]
MTHESYWTTGCMLAASAVALGAFGAHGLRKIITDPSKIKSWETAAHYQLVHSVALLMSLTVRSASDSARSALTAPVSLLPAHLFAAGITMFSGSIYALVLSPRFRFLGPVTPIGGMCLIGGWVALGVIGGKSVFATRP